jgi:hypothetical protein
MNKRISLFDSIDEAQEDMESALELLEEVRGLLNSYNEVMDLSETIADMILEIEQVKNEVDAEVIQRDNEEAKEINSEYERSCL